MKLDDIEVDFETGYVKIYNHGQPGYEADMLIMEVEQVPTLIALLEKEFKEHHAD